MGFGISLKKGLQREKAVPPLIDKSKINRNNIIEFQVLASSF
jgi:hypothetical protein